MRYIKIWEKTTSETGFSSNFEVSIGVSAGSSISGIFSILRNFYETTLKPSVVVQYKDRYVGGSTGRAPQFISTVVQRLGL